jgi:hypothetical protein
MGSTGPQGISLTMKGEMPSVVNLPVSGNYGDSYIVQGVIYTWNGSVWVNGGSIKGPTGPQGDMGSQGDKGDDKIFVGSSGDTQIMPLSTELIFDVIYDNTNNPYLLGELSIVDDLVSGGSTDVLSAQQGKILYNYIVTLQQQMVALQNRVYALEHPTP